MGMKEQGLYSPLFERDNCGAGFICNLKGEKSNKIIHDAIDILVRLEHRGAVSADGKTGDGAGILIEIPHDFFKKVSKFEIPEFREYAVGMVFLPKNKNQSGICKKTFEDEIKNQQLEILGWRKVPVNHSCLGKMASNVEPAIEQVFIGRPKDLSDQAFNAKLYSARKIAEHTIENSGLAESEYFYFSSLSTNTIIYKGL